MAIALVHQLWMMAHVNSVVSHLIFSRGLSISFRANSGCSKLSFYSQKLEPIDTQLLYEPNSKINSSDEKISKISASHLFIEKEKLSFLNLNSSFITSWSNINRKIILQSYQKLDRLKKNIIVDSIYDWVLSKFILKFYLPYGANLLKNFHNSFRHFNQQFNSRYIQRIILPALRDGDKF
jgi:hypothetical protein